MQEAAHESPLWAGALLAEQQRRLLPVFSPLGSERHGLGIETIYEGYLLHYARPRLFALDAPDALLLGDYLYAHGLVRIAASNDVAAVSDLAELISLCAQLRVDGGGNADGWAWAATVALLGAGRLDEARAALRDGGDARPLAELARAAAGNEAIERALATHRSLVR